MFKNSTSYTEQIVEATSHKAAADGFWYGRLVACTATNLPYQKPSKLDDDDIDRPTVPFDCESYTLSYTETSA